MSDKPAKSDASNPSSEPETTFTADETKLVKFQALLLEIDKIRKPSDTAPKPTWQVLIESVGGAALITVLFGGIAGGSITFLFNHLQKERDQQRSSREAQSVRNRVAYEKLLDKRLDLAKTLFNVEGDSIAKAENLLALRSPGFDFCSTSGVTGQIRREYNEADTNWRKQRTTLGLLVSYYNSNRVAVTTKWNEADKDLSAYMDCASSADSSLFSRCGSKPTVGVKLMGRSLCRIERTALDHSLTDLQKALSTTLDNEP